MVERYLYDGGCSIIHGQEWFPNGVTKKLGFETYVSFLEVCVGGKFLPKRIFFQVIILNLKPKGVLT